MAIAITAAAVVKLQDNVLSERQARVKNDGPGSCVVGKDPGLTASSAHTLVIAAAGEETFDLAVGEALYAVCPGGQTAAIEIV